ncbi:hypothetical protein SAMN04488511_11618 [Pedobacter suwonensis]|uniref:Uncharacterized protein n=1 Tax=Pedobacter suwonensis TaxID=332999 RepID=A0A1I0TXP3_9SPHI|nr:hypothetical protein [Pedobacter suwonensis]SFA56505.1 hypothetical protein SAMN04488511_11618 [Pedobacter suwonensis]
MLLSVLLFHTGAFAQVSVFNQGQTLKKRLLEQLVALRVYEQYLSKGYDIARNGTASISTIKTGDLGLHSAYFDSLSRVSSRVRTYPKVGAIARMQGQMIQAHNQAYRYAAAEKQLSDTELMDFNASYRQLLGQAEANMEELQLVVSSGRLKMTDDARLSAIDRLYAQMQRIYTGSASINRKIV